MATVNIYVTLDTNANPAVVLKEQNGSSARSEPAANGDTIKWQKQDTNDDFDITGLSPTGTGEAFSTPTTGGSGQWLSSTYQPPSSDPDAEYPYTLTVTTGTPPNTHTYNTTETSDQATDDRPVIRN